MIGAEIIRDDIKRHTRSCFLMKIRHEEEKRRSAAIGVKRWSLIHVSARSAALQYRKRGAPLCGDWRQALVAHSRFGTLSSSSIQKEKTQHPTLVGRKSPTDATSSRHLVQTSFFRLKCRLVSTPGLNEKPSRLAGLCTHLYAHFSGVRLGRSVCEYTNRTANPHTREARVCVSSRSHYGRFLPYRGFLLSRNFLPVSLAAHPSKVARLGLA